MLNSKLNARLGLIFISLVLILSIFAFMMLNGSLAWLSQNKNVNANSMTVSVAGGLNISADIESYPVLSIEESNGDILYTFDEDVVTAALPLHDPQDINYSEYLRALVVQITVDAPSGASLFLKIAASGELTTATNNFFSNATVYSYAEAVTDSNGDIVPGKVKRLDAADSFVTFSAETPNIPNHKDELTLVGSGGIQVSSEEKARNIYVIIEYNEQFIDYINGILTADPQADKEVAYINDIKFLIG